MSSPSCSCNCTCEGSWETPAVSLPIHAILFGGNNTMHCAQSSDPKHRLACNLPGVVRDRRSIYMDNAPADFHQQIIFVSFAIIIYTFAIIICTLVINRRLKRS